MSTELDEKTAAAATTTSDTDVQEKKPQEKSQEKLMLKRGAAGTVKWFSIKNGESLGCIVWLQ